MVHFPFPTHFFFPSFFFANGRKKGRESATQCASAAGAFCFLFIRLPRIVRECGSLRRPVSLALIDALTFSLSLAGTIQSLSLLRLVFYTNLLAYSFTCFFVYLSIHQFTALLSRAHSPQSTSWRRRNCLSLSSRSFSPTLPIVSAVA